VYDVVQCAEGEFCSHSFGCLPSHTHSHIYHASHEALEDSEDTEEDNIDTEEEVLSVPIDAYPDIHTQTHTHTHAVDVTDADADADTDADTDTDTDILKLPLFFTHPYTSGSTRYTHDELMTTLTHVSPSLTRSGTYMPSDKGERERMIGFVDWKTDEGICSKVSVTERPILIRNTVSSDDRFFFVKAHSHKHTTHTCTNVHTQNTHTHTHKQSVRLWPSLSLWKDLAYVEDNIGLNQMIDVKVLSHTQLEAHTHTRIPTFTNLDQHTPLKEFPLMNMSMTWDVKNMSVGEFFEDLEDEQGVYMIY